jgi:hypothetical protein
MTEPAEFHGKHRGQLVAMVLEERARAEQAERALSVLKDLAEPDDAGLADTVKRIVSSALAMAGEKARAERLAAVVRGVIDHAFVDTTDGGCCRFCLAEVGAEHSVICIVAEARAALADAPEPCEETVARPALGRGEPMEYHLQDGTPTTLDALCRIEPRWAANRIRAEIRDRDAARANAKELGAAAAMWHDRHDQAEARADAFEARAERLAAVVQSERIATMQAINAEALRWASSEVRAACPRILERVKRRFDRTDAPEPKPCAECERLRGVLFKAGSMVNSGTVGARELLETISEGLEPNAALADAPTSGREEADGG